MTSILVVEDDEAIRSAVRRGLTERGYAVATAGTGMAGLEQVLADRPQVVLLDLGLPDVDGLALISMIRAASRGPDHRDHRPGRRPDHGQGPRQRGRRLRGQAVRHRPGRGPDPGRAAPYRRRPERRPEPVRVGDLVIDERTRTATLAGRPLELARKEFDLLLALASRPGEVVTKRELLADVWQQAYGGSDRTVDVHLSWLRRKLGESAAEPRYLHSVRGVGVRLVDPGPSTEPGLMRRRISWLVLATTSTVVVSFVIPLCLLVRTLAEDRAMAAADQEARNVAILVAGWGRRRHARRPGGRPSTTAAQQHDRRAHRRRPATCSGPAMDRRRPGGATGRSTARRSRSSTTTAAGCCCRW